uniref:NADH dehydrogenase [ubiquinone] 1 beta subcomplex subunit 2, mitochondrial n=1 Tax=Pelusios castaneus TaxID=367368 RepID=A0A8C8RFX8_9SAUR
MLRSVVGRAGGLVRVLRGRDGRRTAAGPRQCHAGPAEIRYREAGTPPRDQMIQSELLMGFMWFWVLWHFWHRLELVVGHFPYPDASKWTDEELGIPPDVE